MRTTLDLPDELLKRAKIEAVQRGTSLRDLVGAALQRGAVAVSATEETDRDACGRRLRRTDGSAINHQVGVSSFAEYAVVARGTLVAIFPSIWAPPEELTPRVSRLKVPATVVD